MPSNDVITCGAETLSGSNTSPRRRIELVEEVAELV